MKLNLGCGDQIMEGYINCDLYDEKADVKCDVKQLPFDDNSAENIYASHIIEHFDYYEGLEVLKEWYRVLKPNGIIYIETPDMMALCKRFIEFPINEVYQLYAQFFGFPWAEGQTHKFLYTENQLGNTLFSLNYKNIIRVPARRYINIADLCLGMEASK
jgi:predicted SAM-dependent methyltransferase